MTLAKLISAALAVSALTLTVIGIAQAQRGGGTRAITQIEGDLYRFQNNQHFSVFLVTPDGVIMGDPINGNAAEWLKQEIDERFGVPVKYVVYSHHHADHASGGAVFADTATFIGHENMLNHIAPPADPAASLPPRLATMDTNGNGTVERDEARGQLANRFAALDANGDGSISGFEIASTRGGDVRPPDETYADTMTLTLGGKTVELHYFGKSHSDNMTIMYFPVEKTVFTVDFITVDRLPFRDFSEGYLPDLIEAIRQTESLDFDIVAPGHGVIGGRQDVVAHRQYLEELVGLVSQGIDDGKSVADLQAEITLEKYSSWSQFDQWLPLNIAGAYRILNR